MVVPSGWTSARYSPLALSASLSGELNFAPGSNNDSYSRGWLGLQFGFAIGGVKP